MADRWRIGWSRAGAVGGVACHFRFWSACGGLDWRDLWQTRETAMNIENTAQRGERVRRPRENEANRAGGKVRTQSVTGNGSQTNF